MPTVPIPERRVVTERAPGGNLGATFTEGAFGGNTAAAANKLAGQMYQAEVDRQNQVAFLEADRKMSEWETQTLYDPKNGALTARGKDAFSVPDRVLPAFEDYVAEVNKGLNTQVQRDAFNRSIVARRRDLSSTLARHVFTETRRFEAEETTAYITNARNAAIMNNNDPARIATEVARIKAAVTDMANRNGYGPEYVKARVAKEVSDTHTGIVSRFLQNNQDITARKYFEANKAEIDAADATALEGKLETANTEADGLRTAADIWDELGPVNDIDPVNIDKMHAKARERYANDPKKLKATKQALDERYEKHNAAQRERAEANESAVFERIERGAGLNDVRGMPEYLALPGGARERIKQHIISTSDAMKRRTDIEGDDALYYDLVTQASTPALQQKFLQTNLMEHRPKLSRAQWESVVSIQTALRKGDTKGADKLIASETVQRQIVSDALLSMGLDPTPKETDKDAVSRVTGFRRAVRDAIRQHEVRTQKQASDEEVQTIVDRLITQGKVPGSGILWDDTKRVYQLQPGEPFSVKYADVPLAERRKIEDALRRQGRQVTESAVTSLYTRKLLETNAAQ